jgi:polygalacturonase
VLSPSPVNGHSHGAVATSATPVVTRPPARRARRSRAGGKHVQTVFRPTPPASPAFPTQHGDIRSHGALGDGRFDNTAAIAAAIAACADAGGGVVEVPPGQWLTGPIHLRSNVHLHVASGADLIFTDDPLRYLPPVFVRWGGVECYNTSPFIYARDCSNVAVTGPGRLRGQGASWRMRGKDEPAAYASLCQMVLDGVDADHRRLTDTNRLLLPQLILLINCRGALLDGFQIAEGGPSQTLHLAYCRDVTVRNLSIEATAAPGNDGIKIDSSADVLVEDCVLQCEGDALSIESGLNEDGWRVDRPAENVHVRRVAMGSGRAAVMIGSATAGGVRNVLVEECTCAEARIGLALAAGAGRGGVVEGVVIRDMRLGRITGQAISMEAGTRAPVSPAPRSPLFRNVTIQRVTCAEAAKAVHIAGMPDRHFQNIRLEDVTIAAGRGLHCETALGIDLVNVNITPRIGPVLSVTDTQEVLIEGLKHVPRHGVFLALRGRGTKRIRIRGQSDAPVRPSVVLGTDVPRDALVHE